MTPTRTCLREMRSSSCWDMRRCARAGSESVECPTDTFTLRSTICKHASARLRDNRSPACAHIRNAAPRTVYCPGVQLCAADDPAGGTGAFAYDIGTVSVEELPSSVDGSSAEPASVVSGGVF